MDVWEPSEDISLELNNSKPLESLIAEESNEFQMTFVFDKCHKEAIENYVKTEGKDALTNKIIELCQKWEAK